MVLTASMGGRWDGEGSSLLIPNAANVQLIEQHFCEERDAIRRFIRRRAGADILARTSVDDICQETLAQALASAPKFVFRGEKPFRAWIRTIARRTIAESIYQSKRCPAEVPIRRQSSTGIGVPERHLLSKNRTPSSVVARNEHQNRLKQAMLELPEHYRNVLVLYRLEGHTLAEVAERIGRTTGATVQLIRRANRLLSKKLRTP